MAPLSPLDGGTATSSAGDDARIVLGHGGGGKLSAELVEQLFAPAFRNDALDALGDAAVLDLPPGRLAFSTDTYVVRPLFFPGGSIGDLAINGTVNDLAMVGARPKYLSVGLILEEGLPLHQLGAIVHRMAEAARRAGVAVVTGDTKVVEKGHGDGCYINTSGVGVIPEGIVLGPHLSRPGDAILVSGTIADHGVAILAVREGLELETVVASDSAALNGLVAELLEIPGAVHVLRDPTRGGVAASLNEIAAKSRVGMTLDDRAIPVRPEVRTACDLLGLDPLHVANEGKLIAIVSADQADTVLERMRRHPLGADATRIGTVTADRPGVVVSKNTIGGTKVVAPPIGEQLPRIC